MLKQKILFVIVVFFSKIAASGSGLVAPWVGFSLSGEPCIGKERAAGPWDYTNYKHKNEKEFKKIVGAHFSKRVELLQGGAKENSKSPAGDLDYTLRGIPNHHKALKSMMLYQRFSEKKDWALKKGQIVPMECYFQRAIRFSPGDTVSYLLFSSYLKKTGHIDLAFKQLNKAYQFQNDNPYILYHLALVLIKLNKYDEAVLYAKKAYKIGNPPDLLKNKLKKMGKW